MRELCAPPLNYNGRCQRHLLVRRVAPHSVGRQDGSCRSNHCGGICNGLTSRRALIQIGTDARLKVSLGQAAHQNLPLSEAMHKMGYGTRVGGARTGHILLCTKHKIIKFIVPVTYHGAQRRLHILELTAAGCVVSRPERCASERARLGGDSTTKTNKLLFSLDS